MNRKAILLSIPAFVLCVLSPYASFAIPSNLMVADRKKVIQPASSDRIQIVKRFIQALESRDIRTINPMLADNVVLEQPYFPLQPGGVRVVGKQAANAFFERIFSQYSQVRFVDIIFRQSQFDNAVIIEARGDFRVAKDQSPYRNQYIGVLEVANGRITLIREYFNPLLIPGASSSLSNQATGKINS
jgi:ketosteroid isomerase-like protein